MPQTNPYTILSIGPIYDTIQQADNTRALWTASYIFSYLMQTTILNIRELFNEQNISLDKNFVVPTSDAEFLKSGNRAGLFHDRLILKGDYSQEVHDAFEKAIETFYSEVFLEAFKNSENYTYVKLSFEEQELKSFVTSYFQNYIATIDVPKGENPILVLSPYVDGVENEPRLASHEEQEYLFYFFRVANLAMTKYFSFYTGATERDGDRCFKSVPEIATYEFSKEWDKKDSYFCLTIDEQSSLEKKLIYNSEDDIYDALEEDFKEELKPYHRYMAIVQADGDGFGKYLENIGGEEKKLKDFSNNIFQFANKARAIIEQEGGAAIMAGGDDLLFFAPVVNGEKNIFTTINLLDKTFENIFGTEQGVSMSYGISVSYYKFPLQEALEIAAKALWDEAKSSSWTLKKCFEQLPQGDIEIKAKNAIHINVQKHSGQSHALTLPKNTELYTQFTKLLKQELDRDDNVHLPHSLHHSLERVKAIIDNEKMPPENIKHFFDNMFNENIHKVKHHEALKAVQEILKLLKDNQNSEPIYRVFENKESKQVIKTPSEILFSMLSVIKLLRGDA